MIDEKDHDANLLEKPLRDVLSQVRERGTLEVRLNDEVYTISLRADSLPDEARDFLTKGGPIG